MANYPDVKAATPLETQHITPACRERRGRYEAWKQACDLLWQVYSAQVAHDQGATISVAIYRTPGVSGESV